MQGILDLVAIVLRTERQDASDVMDVWSAVHGGQQVRIGVNPDGSVDTTEIDALVRTYVAAGCHTVRLLLAHMEDRFGVPAAELLDGFERDLIGDDED